MTMNAAERRVAIYAVQYNGTWGWEPISAHLLRREALAAMFDHRVNGCMSREEAKNVRVVRYMPEGSR